MRTCDACGTRFGDSFRACPVCNMKAETIPDAENAIYPPCRDKARIGRLFRILGSSIGWVGVLICIIINIALGGAPWCLYVLFGMYTLFVLSGTELVENSLIERIVSGALAVSLLLFVIERLSGSGRWATDIAVPLVLFAALLAAAVLYLFCFDTQRSSFLAPLTIILGALCAAGFALFGGIELHWPLLVLSGLSVAILILTAILYRKPILAEFKKKLHR